MKCLHVYRTYHPDPPGGLQEAIRQIALAGAAFGVESRIFTLSPDPHPARIALPEGDVIRCRSWAAPASCDLGGITAFRRFAESAEWADILHYHFPWPFADLLHLIVRPATPAVMTYHSDIVRQRWLGRAYAPMMHGMLSGMRAIIATSTPYSQTSPILADVAYRDRVRVIPLGIDESSYPMIGDGRVIERLGLAEGEPFFLFIGVLRYYKGLHTLVRAAKKVNEKIVIAGSGPESFALQAQVSELGIQNVVFAGQVSDSEKVTLLRRCCALVFPSHLRSEAFGMVLVEASMMGRPMVTCEIGTGASFINRHEETGFVVAPESPEALATAINALAGDRMLAQQFGNAARRRYEELFCGPALGRAYAQLYQDVRNN